MQRLSLCVLILTFPLFLAAQNWLNINSQSSGIASDPFFPQVQTMLIDLQGREWYGSDGGLASYYKGRWTSFSPTTRDLPFQQVYGLDVDDENTLYVAAEEGLFRLNGEDWESLEWIVPFKGVNDVVAITADSFFVATNNGFHKYVDGNWSVNNYPSLPSRYVRKLRPAEDGTIWACFDYNPSPSLGGFGFDGIGQYDGNTWVLSLPDHKFGPSRTPFPAGFEDIAIDTSGKVWATSYQDGLFIMDLQDTTFTVINDTIAPFWNNTLLAIDIDSSNQVWIGAQTELIHHDPAANTFEIVNAEIGPFSYSRFRQLYRAPDGALWTVADGEIARLTEEGWEIQHAFQTDGLHGNRIDVIDCQQGGTCYLGIGERGVAAVSDGRWNTSLLSGNFFFENEARDFAYGPEGEVYIATKNGVYQYFNNAYTYLEEWENRLPYPIVTSLEYDSIRGGLWIGTNGSRALGNGGSGQDQAGGLAFYEMETENWSYFTPTYFEEFPGYNHGYYIWALALDDQNRLWVGSNGPTNASYGTLSYLEGDTWKGGYNNLTHPDLPGTTKMAAVPGGGIWFTGLNGGIGYADGEQLEIIAPTFPSGNQVAGYHSIFYDESTQTVYAGTSYPSGILTYDGENTAWLDLSDSPIHPDFGVSAIAKDPLGNFWLGTWEQGLFLYNPNGIVTSDRVWPGDTNSDGYVNMDDVLSLALAFNATGPSREDMNTNWAPVSADNWSQSFEDGLNFKHADCNGNGEANVGDLAVIAQNYNAKHPLAKGLNPTDNPPIRLQFASDSLPTGGPITAQLILGSAAQPLSNIHGLRLDLQFDKRFEQIQDFSLNTNLGWLSNGTELLSLTQEDTEAQSISLAISRTDQVAQSGYGAIATISFTMSPETVTDDYRFSIQAALAVNEKGRQQYMRGTEQTKIVSNMISASNALNESSIRVYPTFMSTGQNIIHFQGIQTPHQLGLFLADGRLFQTYTVRDQITINVPNSGVYFFQIRNQEGQLVKTGKLLVN